MRRKFNFKLLASVVVGLLVVSVGVHFLHGYQVTRNAHLLLERGDQAVADKEDDKALAYYAQYLSFAPNDADTVQKYAVVLDRRVEADDERVRLVLLMEQVLRVKPNEHALRFRLVHNQIALDRIVEALDNVKRLQTRWSDKAEILHLLGWCQEALQKYDQAAESFAAAIQANKKQIPSYALLAEVLHDRLHQPDDARKVMDQLVKENADSYQAHLARARFARQRGDGKSAQSDLQAAYKLAPDKAEVILEVADAARARGDWGEAVRLLKDGLQRFPKQIDWYKEMARVKINTQDRGDAIRFLKDGLHQAPKSNELAVLLVEVLIDQGQTQEAQAKIDELVKAGMKPALRNYLQARIAFVNENWSEAIALLDSASKELGPGSDWSSSANLLLGLCHRQLGNREEELKALRRAVSDEPTWMLANVELGATLLNHRQLAEACQALEPLRTAKDLPPGYWILLSRARLYAEMRLPAAQRHWEGVEEAIDQAAKATSKIAEILVLRAELAAAVRDFAGVRDYRDALLLARLYQLAGDPASADKLFRQALEKAPATPDTWLAWTEHLQLTSRHNQGVLELERMKMALPAKQLLFTLARCYEGLKMPDEAVKAYQDALSETPNDIVTLAHAADCARRAGRRDEARDLYTRLLDPQLAAPDAYAELARRQLANLKPKQK